MLAKKALEIFDVAGPACKGGVLGVLAAKDADGEGTLATAQLSKITGASTRSVRRARQADANGDANYFNSAQRRGEGAHAKTKRSTVILSEYDATRKYMYESNPARSGDTMAVAWMVKSKGDFYYEEYRSVAGQRRIIELALESEHGPQLQKDAKSPKNRWEMNVSLYLRLQREGNLSALRVRQCQVPKSMEAGLRDVLKRVEMDDEVRPEDMHWYDELEELEAADGLERKHSVIPRSYSYFYDVLLSGMLVRKRPPHNYCERCVKYEKKRARLSTLVQALTSCSTDADYAEHQKVVKHAGGRNRASAEQRSLEFELRDLQKHVEWRETARKYLKWRLATDENVLHIQLDYGGFNDSANKKFSVWSATVMIKGRDQEHFDFFFDAHNAKKDGRTGVYLLYEFLEMLSLRFDERNLLLSGDTGNGYRGYEMLEALSGLFEAKGFYVELVPLSPGHAWNRTDARIARLNTLFSHAKAVMHLHGAQQFAELLAQVSDASKTGRRKFLERSHSFFRVVPDSYAGEVSSHGLGAMLRKDNLPNGKIGIRGLLYFRFWFDHATKKGKRITPSGYALVREHGDPNRDDNPSYVYTWRQDLSKETCQFCSDCAQRPVLLEANGCSKRRCAIAAKKGPATGSLLLQGPYSSSDTDSGGTGREDQEEKQADEDEHASEEENNQGTEPHDVRAVMFRREEDGEWEPWLYVPQFNGSLRLRVSKRRCYWLYPTEERPSEYVMDGNLDTIEEGREDIAVLAKVNFTVTTELFIRKGKRRTDKRLRCVLTPEQENTLTAAVESAAAALKDIEDEDEDNADGDGGAQNEDEDEDDEEEDDEEENDKHAASGGHRRLTRSRSESTYRDAAAGVDMADIRIAKGIVRTYH